MLSFSGSNSKCNYLCVSWQVIFSVTRVLSLEGNILGGNSVNVLLELLLFVKTIYPSLSTVEFCSVIGFFKEVAKCSSSLQVSPDI